MKAQARSSLEPPLEYNQAPNPLMKQGLLCTCLTTLVVTEILSSFRLVLERKTGKEIPESSRFLEEFLEKFLANNLALQYAEENTSKPLNRGGTVDLPLLTTLLAIQQKSGEPRFWEVLELACLKFNLDLENLFCWYKQKK